MTILEAQADVRRIYLSGSVGQIVSGSLWFLAAALGTWARPASAILALCLGGALIFPVTQAILRLMGRPASLPPGHPMRTLAMQVAFIVPLTLPVVLGATLHDTAWFFPACLIVVGAHYLPFVFLYGMPAFAALGSVMIASGFTIGWFLRDAFALGGWVGGVELVLFGLLARKLAPKP